ncbi:multicopper oxidase domain-containing protein [Pelosinus baikalensis]
MDVPVTIDGVPDVYPPPKIKPNNYFDYHFEITNPPGVHMYQAHHNTAKQEMLRLAFFVVPLILKSKLPFPQKA